MTLTWMPQRGNFVAYGRRGLYTVRAPKLLQVGPHKSRYEGGWHLSLRGAHETQVVSQAFSSKAGAMRAAQAWDHAYPIDTPE